MSGLKRVLEKWLSVPDGTEQLIADEEIISAVERRRSRFILVLMRDHPRWTIVLVSVALLEVALIAVGNAEHFARFGAVIVLVAVVFGTACARRVQEETDTLVYTELVNGAVQTAKAISQIYRTASDRVVPRISDASIKADLARSVERLHADARARTRYFFRTELLLGALGTFQWAYGDIFINWLSNDWGSQTC